MEFKRQVDAPGYSPGSVPGNVFKSELERQKFDARRISRGPDRVKGFQIGIQEAICSV